MTVTVASPAKLILQRSDALAAHSDHPDHLTCAYMTPAHRAVAGLLASWMREAGFDEVRHDEVGNVIGLYRAQAGIADAPLVSTGSHYDTVGNAGRYDGRLGILIAIAAVAEMRSQDRRLPYDLEVVAFAEEEGVRYGSTFLGSSAYAGLFDAAVLDKLDRQGVSMRDALAAAGLDPERAAALARGRARRPAHYFEVHIEQGPVLLDKGLPLGVVSAINGGVRRLLEVGGVASHAGTTPMSMRHDAACAAAEIILFVEQRCSQVQGLVGTVGKLEVPAGSVNVIAGRCLLSLDVRAPDDAVRDAALADIETAIAAICRRRGVTITTEEVMRACAVPCSPDQRGLWSVAIAAHGIAAHELPSGAGHDAMMIARVAPVSMLFLRCGNGGISHNPLETVTVEDVELACRVTRHFMSGLAATLA